MSTARAAELTLTSRANAFIALTKPDVSFLVLMTTAAGYYMGSRGPLNWLHMLHTVFATMLIAAGTAALNHYIERDSDRFMRRTAGRPLPTGVLQPHEALLFGVLLSIAGAVDLYIVGGLLPSALGVATCLSYLLAYTPLKKRTVWATFVGAFPGAIPPMIGWVAASGSLDRGAWLLFAILFFWQFPHFHAISWMYREDYARAGIRLTATLGDTRYAARSTVVQAMFYAALMMGISLWPFALGTAGTTYAVAAVCLSLGYLWYTIRFSRIAFGKSARNWKFPDATSPLERVPARDLLHASVIYLPLLLAAMMLNARGRLLF
jgi:protoheme IX farnesyltransferase